MRIYLASGFNKREQLKKLAEELKKKGHSVSSTWIWIEERPERTDMNWDAFAERIASANFLDLMASDAIVVDTSGIRVGNNGGVHFETGFMYARNKPVYLVGEPGNTFHWLHDIHKLKDYEELLEVL